MNNLEKLGYWLVNGSQKFSNKNQALEQCTKLNTKDIRYCLEEDRFGRIDWSKEPEIALTELYRLRAQQIRDSYDYVVLTYSGGSDSTNILHSFFSNGIMPDEVISFMLEGKDFSNDKTTFNKEITFNQQAIKDHVLANGVGYSTVDVSKFYHSIFDQDDWCFRSGINRAYITARAHAAGIDRFRKIRDRGKRACIVYGLEKPAVSVDKKNNFYAYLLDIPMQQYVTAEMHEDHYNGLIQERFYITGDMPELTIKQSHIVANYFQKTFQTQSKDKLKIGLDFDFKNYKEIVMDLLYGHCFDQKKCFTIGKSSYKITGLRDDWLMSLSDNDHRKSSVIQGWLQLEKNIDKSFFNYQDWRYDTVGCITKPYFLGKKIQ